MKNLKVSIVASIILGLLTGVLFNRIKVGSAYGHLEESIYNSKALPYLVKNDPALKVWTLASEDTPASFDKIKDLNKQFAWRLLLNAGIITTEDDTDDLGFFASQPLSDLIETDRFSDLQSLTSLDLILNILRYFHDKNDGTDNWVEDLKGAMARCLANQPYAYEYYEEAIKTKSSVAEAGSGAYFLPREFGGWGVEKKNTELIALTFSHFKGDEIFTDLQGKIETDYQENLEEYRQVRELLQTLVVAINNDPAVESARNNVTVYHGIMQLFMYMAFFSALFFILQKLLYNLGYILMSDDSQRNLPKFYNWCNNTIPVMGFVGTIIGLMRALADADQIPLASGNINTSLAISEITGTLSVAFTTTLMAFVMIIIISLVNLVTEYWFKQAETCHE